MEWVNSTEITFPPSDLYHSPRFLNMIAKESGEIRTWGTLEPHGVFCGVRVWGSGAASETIQSCRYTRTRTHALTGLLVVFQHSVRRTLPVDRVHVPF